MRSGGLHKTSAVIEVLLAFAPGRAEQEASLNFSPGAAMLLVAMLFMALHRRRPAAWGLTLRPLRAGVSGLPADSRRLLGSRHRNWSPLRTPSDQLRRRFDASRDQCGLQGPHVVGVWRLGPATARIPIAIGLVLIATAALLPLTIAVLQGRGPGYEALTVLWVSWRRVSERRFS